MSEYTSTFNHISDSWWLSGKIWRYSWNNIG